MKEFFNSKKVKKNSSIGEPIIVSKTDDIKLIRNVFGLPRRRRERGFKSAPEPYHAVGNDEERILALL